MIKQFYLLYGNVDWCLLSGFSTPEVVIFPLLLYVFINKLATKRQGNEPFAYSVRINSANHNVKSVM